MPYDPFPCPRCGRRLPVSGELTVLESVYPVYQCDECLDTRVVLGVTIRGALTFAVNGAGQAFDPADPDRDLTRPT